MLERCDFASVTSDRLSLSSIRKAKRQTHLKTVEVTAWRFVSTNGWRKTGTWFVISSEEPVKCLPGLSVFEIIDFDVAAQQVVVRKEKLISINVHGHIVNLGILHFDVFAFGEVSSVVGGILA